MTTTQLGAAKVDETQGDIEEAPGYFEEAQQAKDGEGTAVAGFISGLIGLLVGNVVLGPLAIVLGVHALRSSPSSSRRNRAVLAIALGVADLVFYAALILAKSHSGLNWHVP